MKTYLSICLLCNCNIMVLGMFSISLFAYVLCVLYSELQREYSNYPTPKTNKSGCRTVREVTPPSKYLKKQCDNFQPQKKLKTSVYL